VLSDEDRSGFPLGTRFQGVVTEVKRHSKDQPGVLAWDVRNAYLPDGQRVSVVGSLASLAEDDVRRTEDGRLESRKSGGKKPDWKWAGYGAAGGAVLSQVFGGNLLKGLLIGGAGGAIYSYLNQKGGKGSFREVELPRGTEFGMRLDNRVAFNDRSGYRYFEQTAGYRGTERQTDRYDDRVGSDRYNDRATDRYSDRTDRYSDRTDRVRDRVTSRTGDDRYADDRYTDDRYFRSDVMVNGRTARYAQPRQLNGRPYFPLSAIADAANMRLDWRRGERSFSFDTRDGRVEGRVGDPDVYRDGRRLQTLRDEPRLEGNELFVSREFLREVGMDARWNDTSGRWEIETR